MRTNIFVCFVLCFLTFKSYAMDQDPAQIEGPKACAECHKRSNEVWQQTPHFKTFKEMSRSEEAKEIAGKLGIERIKKDSTCMQCHYTPQTVEGELKAIAGISCESCHGAGKNYIKVHGDYGGTDVKKEHESPAHRKERLAKSDAAGMIRPSDLYALAKNCYECHTVPNEKLVNVGGHNAGSKFELVAWSQGIIRHNNWYTASNDESSIERRRMMYVVGKMVEMEFALRGLAKATAKADYAKSFVFRYKKALEGLEAIAAAADINEVNAVITIAKETGVKLNAEAKLSGAADKVAKKAKAFAGQGDGSTLAAIDSLLPAPGAYKGKAQQ